LCLFIVIGDVFTDVKYTFGDVTFSISVNDTSGLPEYRNEYASQWSAYSDAFVLLFNVNAWELGLSEFEQIINEIEQARTGGNPHVNSNNNNGASPSSPVSSGSGVSSPSSSSSKCKAYANSAQPVHLAILPEPIRKRRQLPLVPIAIVANMCDLSDEQEITLARKEMFTRLIKPRLFANGSFSDTSCGPIYFETSTNMTSPQLNVDQLDSKNSTQFQEVLDVVMLQIVKYREELKAMEDIIEQKQKQSPIAKKLFGNKTLRRPTFSAINQIFEVKDKS